MHGTNVKIRYQNPSGNSDAWNIPCCCVGKETPSFSP